jgi:hypothetical protein
MRHSFIGSGMSQLSGHMEPAAVTVTVK